MRIKKHNVLDDNLEYVKTHTRSEIAEHFNLSYNQVNNWCIRNNIHPIRERQEKYHVTEDLIEFAKTHTITQTAIEFHLSYYTIQSICRSHSIKPIKNRIKSVYEHKGNLKRTGEAMDMIKALIPTFTDASIARVFGYSKERIRQIRMEMNKKEII